VLAICAFFGTGVLLATYAKVTPRPTTPGANALPTEPTQRPPPAGAKPLRRSIPVHIDIESINVHAPVGSLGTAADGTVQVPPINKPNLTGWYRGSVTPGQTGNAVIIGHVDSNTAGAAVFYRLGDLKRGDQVVVTRQDQSVAVFRVYGVGTFAKSKFPTNLVYGPNTKPELRLVTCGGAFDVKHNAYLANIVAVADMVSSRPDSSAR
jgi:LPXTG-site transpeptidase (sortase) family protein